MTSHCCQEKSKKAQVRINSSTCWLSLFAVRRIPSCAYNTPLPLLEMHHRQGLQFILNNSYRKNRAFFQYKNRYINPSSASGVYLNALTRAIAELKWRGYEKKIYSRISISSSSSFGLSWRNCGDGKCQILNNSPDFSIDRLEWKSRGWVKG